MTQKETERDANLPIYNDCPGEWCKYEYLSLGPQKTNKQTKIRHQAAQRKQKRKGKTRVQDTLVHYKSCRFPVKKCTQHECKLQPRLNPGEVNGTDRPGMGDMPLYNINI